MSLEKRFNACCELLSPWLWLLEVEALKHWPMSLDGALGEWVSELKEMPPEKLHAFQNELDTALVTTSSLIEFATNVQETTCFPKTKISPARLPLELLRKVTPKKKHEIDGIASLAEKMKGTRSVLDVGAGVGHLSSALAFKKDRKVFSVDMSSEFQTAGKERLARWSEETLSKINFINKRFDASFELPEFDAHTDRLVVGLHSCGALGSALTTMTAAKAYERFILASCCYHKLEGHYNISKSAQERGLEFSLNALHLAARCYRRESFKEFNDKLSLRKYRYALHLLEYDRGLPEFRSIGNTKLSDYEGSFGEYAQKYGKVDDVCAEDAEKFYERQSTQDSVHTIIIIDIIRAMLGRVVETYLVLDRALHLEEAGRETEVFEAFDPNLSPRNLVICSSIA